MIETIISSVIAGVFTIAGILISTKSNHEKIIAEQDKKQAITDTKIEELVREVREHNNFAHRMPVVEEQIKVINKRLSILEEDNK